MLDPQRVTTAAPAARRSLISTLAIGLLAVALAVTAALQARQVPPGGRSAPTDELTQVAGGNPATPRHFTGYGFDQCLAPSQNAMDAWLRHSPFWAVGIYISGKSRGCRYQPNITPAWIRTQLANRWRVLPITLGPQASCSTRFPRYGNDPTISPDPSNNYARARSMGRAEANDAVGVAQGLGIVRGSTLWYDLEAFDISQTRCRESALRFVAAWTNQLHSLGYVSGYYSSAASGIKMIDDVRVNRPSFVLPDRIWIADWDSRANVESKWIRSGGWKPGNRMKQYRGDHTERHGGVTIAIDSDFLDLGRGSKPGGPGPTFCGGVDMNVDRWPVLRSGASSAAVKRLQCLLTRQGYYDGPLNAVMDSDTVAAVRAMRNATGMSVRSVAGIGVWMRLHTRGDTYLMKYGAASETVRRLQRALNAVFPDSVTVDGSFAGQTTSAVKRYQGRIGMSQTGVVTPELWQKLKSGRF